MRGTRAKQLRRAAKEASERYHLLPHEHRKVYRFLKRAVKRGEL